MGRKLFVNFMLILLVVTTGFAGGNISGRVTSEENGNALSDVSVFIKDTGFGAYTSSKGNFELSGIPAGNYEIVLLHKGYKKQVKSIALVDGQKLTLDFSMVMEVVQGQDIEISANHARLRETPIAFTNINQDKIRERYTTQDMPQLLTGTPGVFTSSQGLGESEIMIRGFDSERIQVMINGIPVNDPESQIVYWSNWTGLSSNVKSVQVQRGAGSSLYGSGAFGGSLNIETMGVEPRGQFTFRNSLGYYHTQGIESGENEGKVADGQGGFEERTPVNYNVLLKYDTGLFHDDTYSLSFMLERKGGDSYISGTNYDGWSYGMDAQAYWGKHKVLLSFIGAPQKHNQARKTTDIQLMKTLGREYNRNNHSYQENYYFKPQVSLRDEWEISEFQTMMTNLFFTTGEGGGKYLAADVFDEETGENQYYAFKSLRNQAKVFGKHARYIYERSNGEVIVDGYDPEAKTYTYKGETYDIRGATNMVGEFDHSRMNDSQNNHTQFGLNTYYKHELGLLDVTLGGEMRYWAADHLARQKHWRYNDTDTTGGEVLGVYDEVQKRYDYSSVVMNFSGFLRTQFKLDNLPLVQSANIMLDGQYASYNSKVEENPVEFFDFGSGTWTGHSYYATKYEMEELRDDNGDVVEDSLGNPVMVRKFSDSDYEKTFSFFSPKFGLNVNINKNINILGNYSIAYKEPKVRDWYDREDGPDAPQTIEYEDGTKNVSKLDPEVVKTWEVGMGYKNEIFGLQANYYHTMFEDKIERAEIEPQKSVTINAGQALHKGWELSANAEYMNFDFAASATLSKNRWESMNVETIFYEPADSIIGKVVPYSPEQMANAAIGYTFGVNEDDKLRIGMDVNWWDEYYASYTNKYEITAGEWVEAKLPHFFELNANISYAFKFMQKDVSFKLDLNNITNRDENFSTAYHGKDYGRQDFPGSKPYMYVVPSPLFNVFFTTEIKF